MTTWLASLGMYDGGELTGANDALWADIAQRLEREGLLGVPQALERGRSVEDLWSSERLLLGQACGYPLAARLRNDLRVVGVPEYDAPGCTRDYHRSFLIVNVRSDASRLSDLRGSRVAINDHESMTGRHLLGDVLAQGGATRGFLSTIAVTGSHARSLAAVARGEADLAAIDCVTFAHLDRARPDLTAEVRVIHRTRATPGLPFVVSRSCGEEVALLVARALAEAVADRKTADARKLLRLVAVHPAQPGLYERTVALARRADRVLSDATTINSVAAPGAASAANPPARA